MAKNNALTSFIVETVEQIQTVRNETTSKRIQDRLDILIALKQGMTVDQILSNDIAKSASRVSDTLTAYLTEGGIDALLTTRASGKGSSGSGRQSRLTDAILVTIRTKIETERLTLDEVCATLAELGAEYKSPQSALLALRNAGVRLKAQTFYAIEEVTEDVVEDDVAETSEDVTDEESDVCEPSAAE